MDKSLEITTSGLRIVAALAAGSVTLAAHAVPVYVENVTYAWSGGVYNLQTDDFSGASPASISTYAINDLPYAKGAAAASAGSGSLATATFASISGPDASNQLEAVARAQAEMIIDDLVFDGPGSTVATSLNLDWSGLMMDVLMPQNEFTYGIANTYVTISGRLFSGSTTYLEFSGNRTVSVLQDGFGSIEEEFVSTSGLIDGAWPPSGDLVTDMFVVPTYTDISLELSLYSESAVAFYPTGTELLEGTAFATSDFGHTLNLNADGPVFNLALGETVNSLSGDLQNNTWLGTPVSASVVPVPSALYLFGAGAALLFMRPRRH